jgi:hypothetical protein
MVDLARLYYTLRLPTAFSTEDKLTAAVRNHAGVRKWLETQDTYILHRSVRKKFPRNPYTVNNLMDVWNAIYLSFRNLPDITILTGTYFRQSTYFPNTFTWCL